MHKQLSSFFKKASGAVVVMGQPKSEETSETTTTESTTQKTEESEESKDDPPIETIASETTTPQAVGNVTISQERFTKLEQMERELNEMKPKYEILSTWYQNVKGEEPTVGKDALDTNSNTQAKSWEKAPWNQ